MNFVSIDFGWLAEHDDELEYSEEADLILNSPFSMFKSS